MATLNLRVEASTDDARERQDGVAYDDSGDSTVRAGAAASDRYTAGNRFTTSTIANGDTVDSCTTSIYVHDAGFDDISADIHFDDVDDSATFSSGDTPVDRTPTTASVAWSADGVGVAKATSGDLAVPLQEVVDRGGFSAGADVSILLVGKTGAAKRCDYRTWDSQNVNRPELVIDFTVGGPAAGNPWYAYAQQ